MKSKYFDYLQAKDKSDLQPMDIVSPWKIVSQLSSGTRYYVLSMNGMDYRFKNFSSLNDFMLSNGLI